MNRINITINSRVYTVVADEDTQYLQNLCDYVNEKVNTVISEGEHVQGEKPVVLAALNICDEYFKELAKKESGDKLSDIMSENKRLQKELDECRKTEKESDDKFAELDEELSITKKVLDETEEKVKFLEGQVTAKENQVKKQRSEFAIREKELLDMLESRTS